MDKLRNNKLKYLFRNVVLFYGVQCSGKSTQLGKIYNIDSQQNGHDLCISFQNTPNNVTVPYINFNSNKNNIPALSIPLNTIGMVRTLKRFSRKFFNVRHVLIDECQAINFEFCYQVVYSLNRLYPNTTIIMAGTNNNNEQDNSVSRIKKFCMASVHFKHKCFFCNNTANYSIIVAENSKVFKNYDSLKQYEKRNKLGRMQYRALPVCSKHFKLKELSKPYINTIYKLYNERSKNYK